MKRLLLILSAIPFLTLVQAQDFSFSINPQAGFLVEAPSDVHIDALVINLNDATQSGSLGIQAGTTVQLTSSGAMKYYSTSGGYFPVSPVLTDLGGVFATQGGPLLSDANAIDNGTGVDDLRILGALPAPAGTTNDDAGPTFDVPHSITDIPQEFAITPTGGITVVVPTGAEYLWVGVLDNNYSDNIDYGLCLKIDVVSGPSSNVVSKFSPNLAPEPGSIFMTIAGLCAMGLFVRRKSA